MIIILADTMSRAHKLYSWNISPYSQKCIAYMRYKSIPHTLVNPNMWQMYRTLPAQTTVRVIPVMQTADNVWIQDSHAIIKHLEEKHPKAVEGTDPILPDIQQQPTKRFVTALVETWADEIFPPFSMHTRWSYPETNYKFFRDECGELLLPGFPSFMKDYCCRVISDNLKKIMKAVGVRPDQVHLVNEWIPFVFDKLDAHFKVNKFLLGELSNMLLFECHPFVCG